MQQYLSLCLGLFVLTGTLLAGGPARAQAQPAPTEACFTVAEYYRVTRTEKMALLRAYHRMHSDRSLGCIARVAEGVPLTIQPFQRGVMLLFNTGTHAGSDPAPPVGTEGGFIYAMIDKLPLRFAGYRHFWRNPDGLSLAELLPPPEAGLREPWPALRHVWAGDDALRAELGWAIEDAQFQTATVIFFDLNLPTSNPNFPNSRTVLMLNETTGDAYAFHDPKDEFSVRVLRAGP